MRLAGRTAIITGAAAGIGAATARAFAREGATLVLTDIDGAGAAALAAELGGIGLTHDVRDEAAWAAVMAQTQDRCGRPDVLVNNAGIGPSKPLLDTTLDDFRAVTAINLDGVFLGCRFGAAAMRATPEVPRDRAAAIINVSSILGLVGMAGTAAYSASKGGVRLLTKTIAIEAASKGWMIRVNSVHPGFTWTPMVQEAVVRISAQTGDGTEATQAGIAGLHPLGRMGTPEEIAAAILFLASDESSFMTGSELVADGGYTAI
ncbi:MAG: SDR family oxidoreductase [Rhodobacter sp.]|nr:SDR family oxidoreductase [Rhodobacter sp.]